MASRPILVARNLGLGIGLLLCSLSTTALGPAAGLADIAHAQSPQTPSVQAGQRDCGNDLGCLIEASRTCQPAAVRFVSSVGLITNTSWLEIRSGDADACTFYDLTMDQRIQFTGDVRQEMRDQGLSEADIQRQEDVANGNAASRQGSEALCQFPASDLTALLTRWSQGTFSAIDLAAPACNGGLSTS